MAVGLGAGLGAAILGLGALSTAGAPASSSTAGATLGVGAALGVGSGAGVGAAVTTVALGSGVAGGVERETTTATPMPPRARMPASASQMKARGFESASGAVSAHAVLVRLGPSKRVSATLTGISMSISEAMPARVSTLRARSTSCRERRGAKGIRAAARSATLA